MAQRYDLSDDSVVVVIGSGAGGGTVANELAQRGVDVVCLEAGSRLEISDIRNDPPFMDQVMGWHDRREGAPVWLCKTVGGTTMRWSAVSPRFKDFEFRARSTYGAMDDTTLIDWPLGLDELEPYYELAETKMGVSGTGGRPPSAENNNYKVMAAGAHRIGYRDITSSNIAINSIPYDNRPACRQIGFCNDGCAIGAKWSTLYTEIPKAEVTGHFELRANCMALKINHDAKGKVTGVVYQDASGNFQEQKARVICLAANVVETTRLLLLSESNLFPNGLANSSGQVGRNYTRHMANGLAAVMPKPVHFYRGARQAGIIRDEHRHDPSRGFAGGYLFQTSAGPPEWLSEFAGWGETAAEWMEQFNHFASVFLVGEDPPQASNWIYLHPTEKDERGLPVPVLEYAHHPNTTAMLSHADRKARELFAALGGKDIRGDTDKLGGGCHNMGVARMSVDPRDGVTNRWGRAHDVSNLYISDGSVFTTSAAPNPTLTIVALAIRQAEHIAASMSRGDL
ncbi:GMC family oxidoreductase [Erythrobacter mangrovi]|uniref:GMC family oxidoreductase n=1 Tax=Erythrobacter mangrovi TaxID=2739433 RepID=A0A7D4ASA1_9SPHN|nr:GMC family oxidoreductase [Erythrobacter mangrovi]QKG69977.1 GMC family oxidoreductase [Erythrobacter mangrovi]